MLKFEFYLPSDTDEVHEFDLGNMRILTDLKVITSEGKNPDQSMMIFISASQLLSGISGLYIKNTEKEFKFIGDDSSFKLLFKKSKDGKYEIYHEGEKIGEFEAVEVMKSAFNATNDLYVKYGERLLGSGAAKEDLEYVLESALKLIS